MEETEYAGKERRRHPRLSCGFYTHYRDPDSPAGDIAQLKNLSLGGAFFTTAEAFERGSLIDLKIGLPLIRDSLKIGAKVIESVKVVRSLIYYTRVEFSDFPQGSRNALAKSLDILFARENRR